MKNEKPLSKVKEINIPNRSSSDKFGKTTITNELCYELYYEEAHPVKYICAGITFPIIPHEIVRKTSDSFCFEYVYEGEGAVQHGDQIFKVQKGDMFILHPHTYHHYYSNPKNPWRKIFFFTNSPHNFISHLVEDFSLTNKILIKGINSPLRIEQIFNLLKNNEYVPPKKIEMLILAHCIELADYCNNLNNTSHSIPERIKNYIDTKIDGLVKLDDICKFIGMGKTQLINTFYAEYGITPMAYLSDAKIRAARLMLTTSNDSISQIAEKLHFYNHNYFSQTFKKIVGYTPTEYRQKFSVMK